MRIKNLILLEDKDSHTNSIASNLLHSLSDNNICLNDIGCAYIEYDGELIFKIPLSAPKQVKYDEFLKLMKLSMHYKHTSRNSIKGVVYTTSKNISDIGNLAWLELDTEGKDVDWRFCRMPEIPDFLDGFEEGYVRKELWYGFGIWVELDNEGYYHYEVDEEIGCGDQSIIWTWKTKERMNDFLLPVHFLKQDFDDIEFIQLDHGEYGFSLPTDDGFIKIGSNEFKSLEPTPYHLELAYDRLKDRRYWWSENE